ncbi:hypothetical protein J1779_07805 [Rahnella sp. FC061912-K]|uniref:hypothetical protein n=1 Tax=Rahnella rivi TaxID=2816249 RepID=UPI001C26D14B|nr:hypothetical protein [Rahnella rivi]MBU9829834.1 hypothetical protein [Rahnella rivi]
MSIKTYEIHNSYLQDAPDGTGITRMVSEADYLSQLQQTDALQTSLNNIINAFGISGEGAHSKLVIEYVHGLVAESGAMKDINAWCRTDAFQNMYREFKIAEAAGCDVIDCMHDAMLTAIMHAPATPKTDAFTAELRAQGVGEFAADMWKRGNELVAEGGQKRLVVQVRLAAKLADTYAANLRTGRKG